MVASLLADLFPGQFLDEPQLVDLLLPGSEDGDDPFHQLRRVRAARGTA